VYGTLLSIFKLLSEILTAAFGILGLLTEFRDKDKKITRTGKIALVGILASFLVAATTNILELEKSKEDAIAHEKEVQRLLHPFGDFQVTYTLAITEDLPDQDKSEIPELHAYMSGLQNYFTTSKLDGPDGFVLRMRDGRGAFTLPVRRSPENLGKIPEPLSNAGDVEVVVFRPGAFPCDKLTDADFQDVDPDLVLGSRQIPLASDNSALWVEYVSQPLALERTLDFDLTHNSGVLSSIEDFSGTTLIFKHASRDSSHFVPRGLRIRMARGVYIDLSEEVMSAFKTDGEGEYCFAAAKN